MYVCYVLNKDQSINQSIKNRKLTNTMVNKISTIYEMSILYEIITEMLHIPTRHNGLQKLY